jgi:ketosteroid isomerase-like protein
MTREEMDRVVEQHFAMEARADIDGILTTFTDDIEHDVVGVPGGPLRGKEAARTFYEALTRELPATDAIPRHRYYGDNVLVDEVLWEARADGHPFGIDGQGRPVQVRLLHVFAFRGGLIARENLWLDWAAFAAQLGSLPVAALA